MVNKSLNVLCDHMIYTSNPTEPTTEFSQQNISSTTSNSTIKTLPLVQSAPTSKKASPNAPSVLYPNGLEMLCYMPVFNGKKVTPDLWPFAVLYAVDIWNHSPSQTKECPLSASSTSSSPSLDHFHPFGCPVYILNRSLADGNSIPRWQPRSHLGIYLGRSPNHAKDVSLILDLTTNYISAKYHIIYDNKVETTTNSNNNNKIWTTLFIEQLQSTYSQHLPPPSTVDLQQHPSSPTKPIHPTNNVRNAPPNSSTFRSERLSRPLSPSRLSSWRQSIFNHFLSPINYYPRR